MARERNKPQGTTLERIDKDYEEVISQRHKDFKDGYNKAKKKAYNWISENCDLGKSYINANGKTCYTLLDDFLEYMEE